MLTLATMETAGIIAELATLTGVLVVLHVTAPDEDVKHITMEG